MRIEDRKESITEEYFNHIEGYAHDDRVQEDDVR